MKNLIVLFSITLFSLNTFSQWVVKKVDNGFDKPYTIAYTNDGQDVFLKLENYQGIGFYISGGYTCDENVAVDISFLINGEFKKYKTTGNVSENHKIVFMVDDMRLDLDFLNDFKIASSVRIRINDMTCDTEIYEFSMSGSTAAFTAVANQ